MSLLTASPPSEAILAPRCARSRRSSSATLTRWLIALVAVGIGWRTFRYLLQLPIWGDEAFVALNLLDRGYLGLLKPLRFAQVAPVLFMWSELTVFRALGGSELSL